jgi:undecaprenyl-diphosphatase
VADPGLPSDHVTVFSALGFAALWTQGPRRWGLALLAAGLVVGWSRVFLGVHFPWDVLAALPVGLAGAAVARALRGRLLPAYAWIGARWERLAGRAGLS